MNLTLSADDRVIEDARIWAADHGTSINALVRDYLSGLGAKTEKAQAAEQFVRNARGGGGRSDPGTTFKRNELYEGSRFGDSER